MKTQRDDLYLFFCHLEWRDRRNPDAYQELMAARDDQDTEMRQVAESLLHRSLEPRREKDHAVIKNRGACCRRGANSFAN